MKNWCDIATLLYSKGLEFISGKWFFKGEEIKEIEKWLMHTDEIPYHDLITSDLEADRCRDTFIKSYGVVGDWFELPIIAEAKAQKELKPLCLPLETKQLKIINRLLTPHQQKFFIITGVGGSGKSTFLNIIKQIFDNDFASLSLSDLGCDFKLATGINKRLICSDELAADDLNNAALKTIISGQEMPINPKFATPYKAKFQSSFIFVVTDLQDSIYVIPVLCVESYITVWRKDNFSGFVVGICNLVARRFSQHRSSRSCIGYDRLGERLRGRNQILYNQI